MSTLTLRTTDGHYVAMALLWLCLASPVAAQETVQQKATIWTLAAGGSLGMADIVFSEACIQQGSCREANPVLPDGKGAGATAGRTFIKAAGTTASVVILAKLRHKHPKWALVGSVAFAGLNGWLAANAFDYLRKGQR